MKTESGILQLCATPIGNMGDITLRVLDTLRGADLIAAEDTRHTRALLSRYDIHTPLTSYHEHNKYDKAKELIELLHQGKNIALVTDAGTPAISDPGQVLVAMCREEGITVTSLPGACALITALTLSGMDSRRFVFEGFLPPQKKDRDKVLASLRHEPRTVILYEAPHHIRTTVSELCAALGERTVTLCRELTKIHEEALTMTLFEAESYFAEHEPRGEYVLVIGPGTNAADEEGAFWADMTLAEHLEHYMAAGLDKKEAMKQMAADRGVSKRDIYQGLLEK